jgi:hypothetical protein
MWPNYPLESRVTVRKEVMELCAQEKEKMYAYFRIVKCRFSATMDMWTSNQNKGYMCITLHWIDDDLKIQNRIVNFVHLSGMHTGENLSDTLIACLLKWYVEKKMFSLTLNNASANEVVVIGTTQEAYTTGNACFARAVGEDSNPVGEGFPNRVSEFLLGKNRWRVK